MQHASGAALTGDRSHQREFVMLCKCADLTGIA